jgi:two-component system, NarL family, invasion response regulator UvrY
MIRVLVVDDHTIVRRGLSEILADTPDLIAAGEAATAQDALQAVQAHPYDVVLLDLGLPDMNGLELLQRLSQSQPHLHILVLSMYPEEQYAVRALKAGAAGYLTKESAPADLVTAIYKVMGGGRYITPSIAESLAMGLTPGETPVPLSALSEREMQVLRLMGMGQTSGEIAQTLALSVKTVSTYRQRLLDKLQLKTTPQLIRFAIEHGLIDRNCP